VHICFCDLAIVPLPVAASCSCAVVFWYTVISWLCYH